MRQSGKTITRARRPWYRSKPEKEEAMPEISRHAVVEPTAELAADVRVGAFSHVGPQVWIGPGCVIHDNVYIGGSTTIGPRCRVFPMSRIGVTEAGAAPGRVEIGEANIIREHVTILAGADRPTRLGLDNLIMIGCRIGAGSTIGNHEIFANCTSIGNGAVVEDYVRSSGYISVRPNVTVGAYTFMLGYSEVDRDAPPFAMVQGSPFRVRGVNSENLKRCGFDDADIRGLKAAFRELFNGEGGDVDPQALAKLLAESAPSPWMRQLIAALRPPGGPA